MASASDIFLYWGSGSPPCMRVMIALEEKGLSGYGHKLLSFSEKQHKSDEVMKHNPRGQVPTLKIGDVVINESLAALFYLEDICKSNGTRLIPEDASKKALVMQRTMEVNCMQDAFYKFYMVQRAGGDAPADKLREGKDAVVTELKRWEEYLKQSGGPFLCGADFTLADCAVFPNLALMVRMGANMSQGVPSLVKYYEAVCQRASVKATWPPHWKESPNQTVLADLF